MEQKIQFSNLVSIANDVSNVCMQIKSERDYKAYDLYRLPEKIIKIMQ